MGKHLLRYISAFGIGLYLVALITISLVFKSHALPTKWIIWGISEVLFFFVLTSVFYPRWKSDDSVLFWRKVFWVALAVRVAYVIFSYYYYCFQSSRLALFLITEQGRTGSIFSSQFHWH